MGGRVLLLATDEGIYMNNNYRPEPEQMFQKLKKLFDNALVLWEKTQQNIKEDKKTQYIDALLFLEKLDLNNIDAKATSNLKLLKIEGILKYSGNKPTSEDVSKAKAQLVKNIEDLKAETTQSHLEIPNEVKNLSNLNSSDLKALETQIAQISQENWEMSKRFYSNKKALEDTKARIKSATKRELPMLMERLEKLQLETIILEFIEKVLGNILGNKKYATYEEAYCAEKDRINKGFLARKNKSLLDVKKQAEDLLREQNELKQEQRQQDSGKEKEDNQSKNSAANSDNKTVDTGATQVTVDELKQKIANLSESRDLFKSVRSNRFFNALGIIFGSAILVGSLLFGALSLLALTPTALIFLGLSAGVGAFISFLNIKGFNQNLERLSDAVWTTNKKGKRKLNLGATLKKYHEGKSKVKDLKQAKKELRELDSQTKEQNLKLVDGGASSNYSQEIKEKVNAGANPMEVYANLIQGFKDKYKDSGNQAGADEIPNQTSNKTTSIGDEIAVPRTSRPEVIQNKNIGSFGEGLSNKGTGQKPVGDLNKVLADAKGLDLEQRIQTFLGENTRYGSTLEEIIANCTRELQSLSFSSSDEQQQEEQGLSR